MRGVKHSNEYARLLPWYDEVPKAVLAAIAVSLATGGGDWLELAATRVANEWQILHENGIVPQRPSPEIMAKAPGAKA